VTYRRVVPSPPRDTDSREKPGHDGGRLPLIDPASLPPDLTAALARLAEGQPRRDIAARAAEISSTYRGGGSSAAIRTNEDALAYAMSRAPATYAATVAGLNEIARLRPDFAPTALIDAGAGPGTASWAAAEAFPTLASILQIDANPSLRALARELTRDIPRFAALRQDAADLARGLAISDAADLVVASYVIGELDAASRPQVGEALWRATADTLLLVEPGTPAGHARLMALRAQLLAAGAHMLAPCPHALACPLSAPDWCHFTQRLARSRDHKQVKGAELPFEDEKFCYVALSRNAPALLPAARVLAQPVVTKIEVAAKLCRADGRMETVKAPRRDKARYADAKRWRWGDAVDATESVTKSG